MKESNYNFFISDCDEKIHLIYNILKNTLVRDDDCKIQKFINKCNGNIQFNSDYISEKSFYDLVSSGIIIPNDLDEKQKVIDLNKKRLEKQHNKNDILSLVITPTLQCNCKCFYCFESTKIRKGEDALSMNIQNDIIHFISESIKKNHIKVINIIWYGGEPLIRQRIIFSMQKKINTICKLHDVKLRSDIVTNGILLTPEVSELLYEHGIRMAQITIDGPETTHNKRRIYPAAPVSNYKTIIDNLLKANENIRFNIRINIDKTNKDLIFSLIDDLVKWKIWPFKKNVYFFMAKVRSNDIKIGLSYKEFAIFEDRVRYYLTNKYNEITQTNEAKLRFLYPIYGGDVRCGYDVLRNAWVISYNGDLFRCWESVGCKEHSVGTVKDLLEDFGLSIFEKIKVDNQTFEQRGCFECKYLPVCTGGCPWDFLNSNKNERRCTKWKSILEYRLLNQYKLFLNEPDIFKNIPFNAEKNQLINK
jgi:uncharacterized protein